MASTVHLITQTVGLGTVIIAASATIMLTVTDAASMAVAVLVGVALLGLYVCRRIRLAMDDAGLDCLGTLWLIKIALTLALLYAGWIPELHDQNSTAWGYDPQRYYVQAYEFAMDGWSPELLAINYLGVLYYYGALFVTFGHNPVVPAVLNAFLTLIATLFLIHSSQDVVPGKVQGRWVLGLAMLLPEVLWFDALTSREGPLAALVVMTLIAWGRVVLRTTSISAAALIAMTVLGMIAITGIRTSMLPPLLLAIVLMAVLLTRRASARWLVLLTIPLLAVLLLSSNLIARVAGVDFDWWQLLRTATDALDNVASSDDVQWSQNSIGLLLLPDSVMQAIFFLPLRAILYLLAPLPNAPFTLTDLTASRWSAWQGLALFCSAVINVVIFPRALASLIQACREHRRSGVAMLFHIPYWMTFAAIAGGNLIIHERYRVMVSALLWSCAWLSAYTCPPALVRRTTRAWMIVLATCTILYGAIKLVGV